MQERVARFERLWKENSGARRMHAKAAEEEENDIMQNVDLMHNRPGPRNTFGWRDEPDMVFDEGAADLAGDLPPSVERREFEVIQQRRRWKDWQRENESRRYRETYG
jgi:hypothetical protein